MMKSGAWTCAVFFSSLVASVASPGQTSGLLEKANDLYAAGLYDSAAIVYGELALSEPSAIVEYNLANALFKSNQLAPAILHYERALRLDPDDEDIVHNLRIANLRVSDKAEETGTDLLIASWHRFLGLLSGSQWSLLSIILVWLAFVAALVVLFFSRGRLARLVFWCCVVLTGVAVLTVFINAAHASIGKRRPEAIVMQAAAYVKSEPRAESTDLFILHEGAKVHLMDSYKDFKKVRFGSDKVGWMSTEAIEEI
jgi:tetratricopeptide (TPR) repeat protein